MTKIQVLVGTLLKQAAQMATIKASVPVALLLSAVAIFWPLVAMSQNTIKYFGYAYGADYPADLSKTGFYTNFALTDGAYGESLVTRVNAMTAANILAVIDLGHVLWCQVNGKGPYHLCSASDQGLNYQARWYEWKSLNQSVLNSKQVLAFQVIDEPSDYGIPDQDVDKAAKLVKGDFKGINTFVIEAAEYVSVFRNSPSLDWVGLDQFAIDPLTDNGFNSAMAKLKQIMYKNQKIVYTVDGSWDKALHGGAGLCPADMASIAYEWYRKANADTQTAILGVFLWQPSENCPKGGCASVKCSDTCNGGNCPGIASTDLPQSVRDAQIAIGRTILGKSQGYLDGANCQVIWGWAWYSDEPNTPINVDIYDGNSLLSTVDANLFRQDLLNAGKGNGDHAFVYNVPDSLRNNELHSISANYGGTQFALFNTPRSITCPVVLLAPSSVDFGEEQVGDPSDPVPVALINSQSVSLSITGIKTTGNGYSQTNNCGTSLKPHSSCTVSVVFTPGGRGIRTGTLTVTDNGPGSPQTTSLTGTGGPGCGPVDPSKGGLANGDPSCPQ